MPVDPGDLVVRQGGGDAGGQGKRRAELAIPQGASEADITSLALASPEVQRHLAGQTPRRVIYVPGKLLNIVV